MAARRGTSELEQVEMPVLLPPVVVQQIAPPVPPAPPPPPPPPAPAPAPSVLGRISTVFQQVTQTAEEAKQTLEEAKALVLAVAPLPTSFASTALLQWARELKALAAARPDVAKAIATIESAYPPKDGGGGLLEAFGKAVETVVEAGGAVIDVAAHSVGVQVAVAIATSGLSLAAQAAAEAATGSEGPVLGTIRKAVEEPITIIKELPGVLLTETGLVGVVADVVSATGSVINVVAPNTSVGQVAGAVAQGVEAIQQGAKDNPAASLAVIGGIAATAVGLPGGRDALLNGIEEILGVHSVPPPAAQPPTTGNTGFLPPAATAAQASTQPSTALPEKKTGVAAVLERFSTKELAAAGVAVLGLLGLGAWGLWGRA